MLHQLITGAIFIGCLSTITFSEGKTETNDTSKEIVGHNGEATYSAEIKPNSKDNSNIDFRTTVQAFAPGYISTSKASSYSSSSSTLIMIDNSHQESIINNNASSNLAQNILKNVQNKLEQNGIDFSLEH
ncbi:MAG: hypothetical protein WBZ36_01555 [Candidatus Nitrosopolaris sp.]